MRLDMFKTKLMQLCPEIGINDRNGLMILTINSSSLLLYPDLVENNDPVKTIDSWLAENAIGPVWS